MSVTETLDSKIKAQEEKLKQLKYLHRVEERILKDVITHKQKDITVINRG
jgi:hypothetical protein